MYPITEKLRLLWLQNEPEPYPPHSVKVVRAVGYSLHTHHPDNARPIYFGTSIEIWDACVCSNQHQEMVLLMVNMKNTQ